MSKVEKTIKKSSTKGLNQKEIQQLMYGFGDVEPSSQDPETVNLVESLCVEFISETTKAAASLAGARITKKELLFAIRKNKKQQNRARELMIKHVEITKVRKDARESMDPKF